MAVRLPETVLHDAFDLAVDGITLIAGPSFSKSTLLREAAAYCAFSVAAEYRIVELHAGTLADAPNLLGGIGLIEPYVKTEPSPKTREVIDMLDPICRGRLGYDFGRLVFFPSSGSAGPIPYAEVPYGKRIGLAITELLSRCLLSEGDLLVIDHPEDGLHPTLQVPLAASLVRLYRNLGVRTLIATDSPFTTAALETHAKRDGVSDVLKCINAENEENGRMRLADVSERIGIIYDGYASAYQTIEDPAIASD